jgi:hypothetical protein
MRGGIRYCWSFLGSICSGGGWEVMGKENECDRENMARNRGRYLGYYSDLEKDDPDNDLIRNV